MKTFQTIGRSLKRIALPGLGVTALAMNSCAPLLDPNHPDQAPDANYILTGIKDQQYVGSIAAVDAIVNQRIGTKFPGAAIAIVCGNHISYMKGYGLADADNHVPFDKSTVAGIGSISKVLTATAIMRLVEMGEVQLTDPIDSYFTHAVPAGWDEVTVRDLLCHQGGFDRDPDSSAPGFLDAAAIDASFGEEKASQHPRHAIWETLLTAQGAPDQAKIGTTYSYSNLGYLILGAIIDTVTQDASFAPFQGYERFVWSQVADGEDGALTACLNHYWREDDIPNLAKSYNSSWNDFSTDWSGWQGPPGGWSMTIGDLARFAVALKGNKILEASSLAAMRANQGNFYGFGLMLNPKNSRVAYGHGGAIDGFRSQLTIWPNEDVAVVAFVNRGKEPAQDRADDPVDLYAEVDAMASEIGELWIDFKENLQVVEVFFPEEDRRRVNTAAFEVSRHHFEGAQRAVQALIRSESHDYEAVAKLLEKEIGGQGELGTMLIDQVRRNPAETERAASQFLALLDQRGKVGNYEPALAKSTLAPDLKGRWAYSENGAWVDGGWDSAARGGGQGVFVTEHILAGQAYAGNMGWVSLGDGSPRNGLQYSNLWDDHGVNLDLATGRLRGFGYGGNIGWVTFEPRGNPRLDLATGCFLGYVYSANCGWINLAPDHGKIGWKTVGLAPEPDSDADGLPDPWELEQTGNLIALAGDQDSDGDGQTDAQEHTAGTDPLDPDSLLRLWVTKAPDGHGVWWTSQPTRVYTLYATDDLEGWGAVRGATGLTGEPIEMGVEIPQRKDPRTLWRVEASMPFGP